MNSVAEKLSGASHCHALCNGDYSFSSSTSSII